MTMIFVDCEFNGFGGELMSMALVHEGGECWYGVLPLPDKVDPWVMENVVPVFHAHPISMGEFRSSAIAWLRQFDNPTIVADWYTDLVHFFGLFAGDDHSQSVGYACKAELILIDSYASEIPHNALFDAKAIATALIERNSGNAEDAA